MKQQPPEPPSFGTRVALYFPLEALLEGGGLMMFKNETLVRLGIAVGLATALQAAAVESSPTINLPSNVNKCDGYDKLYEKAPESKKESTWNNWQKCLSDQMNQGDCNNASKEFNKAKGEFIGACKAIPTGGKSTTPGNIACAEALQKCDCQFQNTDSESATAASCPMKTSASGGGELIDIAAARERYKYCPMMAAKDIDKIEQDLKDAKKEIKEEEKKIPELQEAMANAQSQGDEKIAQVKQQMAEAAKEYGKAKQEAKKAMEEAHNQLAQQLLQLGEEISKVEEQRGQIKLQRTEAAVRRTEAISAIDISCHTSALAQIQKMQAERLELERSNNLNRGGFNNMLKNIGVSDRQSWQRVALKYYNWCMQSSPTRTAKENAGNIYEAAMKTADTAEKALDRRQDDIRKRMNKIKSNDGCSGGSDADGSSNDSSICQATRKALEEGAQADRDYQNQSRNLAEQGRNAQLDAARKVAAKSAALQKASSDIAAERSRIRNLAEFLDLKRDMGNGFKVTAAQEDKAREKFGILIGAAAEAFTCVAGKKPSESDSTNSYARCAEDASCQEAANFWHMTGEMPEDQWAKFKAASGSTTLHDLGPETGGTRERSTP